MAGLTEVALIACPGATAAERSRWVQCFENRSPSGREQLFKLQAAASSCRSAYVYMNATWATVQPITKPQLPYRTVAHLYRQLVKNMWLLPRPHLSPVSGFGSASQAQELS